MNDVTRVLQAIEHGDGQATDRLLSIVYDELRRLAAAQLSRESPGQTLQTTALVHEAYLRLVGGQSTAAPTASGDAAPPSTPISPAQHTVSSAAPAGESPEQAVQGIGWRSRAHFFAAAGEAMRRILIEAARRKGRLKRGGDRWRIELDHADPASPTRSIDLIALDEALAKLEVQDKAKADVVKLRYFAGMTIDETAAALGVSLATIKREWFYARAWLRREISKGDEAEKSG